MNYTMGDLLWIPQATLLYKGSNNPAAIKFNEKPKVAIYKKEAEYEDYSIIMVDGEDWVVERKHIRKLKEGNNVSKAS